MKNIITKKAPNAALDAEKTKLPKEQIMTKRYSQLYSFFEVKNQIKPAAKPIKTELAISRGSEKKLVRRLVTA